MIDGASKLSLPRDVDMLECTKMIPWEPLHTIPTSLKVDVLWNHNSPEFRIASNTSRSVNFTTPCK